MKSFFIIQIFLLLYINKLNAQFYSISGIVQDSLTNEVLPYALIVDRKTGQSNISNSYGYYSLKLNSGEHDIQVSYIGYTDFEIKINIQNNIELNVKLSGGQTLPELIITDNAIINTSSNAILFSPLLLKKIPIIGGETDIIKAISILPGVSQGLEASNQVFVRGGGSDQNLVLVDGATLYQSSHLFGFLSAINTHVIKSINFMKGGIPAKYGSRLSSVLDINIKEGNRLKTTSKLNVGLVTTSFVFESPLKKQKSSVLFGFRTAYPGLFTAGSKARFENGNKQNHISFYIYDYTLKASFDLGQNSKLVVSTYASKDNFSTSNRDAQLLFRWNLNWGNTIYSIKYFKPITPALKLNIDLSLNKFSYLSNIKSNDLSSPDNYSLSNSSSVLDKKLDIQLTNDTQKGWNNELGISVIESINKPNINFLLFNKSADSLNPSDVETYNSKQLNFYWTNHFQIHPKLELDMGARYGIYGIKKKTYTGFEPRLSAIFKWSQALNFTGSFTINKQYIHLINNPSAGFITEVWIPLSNSLEPQKMNEFTIGTKSDFNTNINFGITLYFRRYQKQSDLKQNLLILRENVTKWEDLLETKGIGRSKGMELFIEKNTGLFQYMLNYTLSSSERKFENINSGQWYPHKSDRRHILNLNASYRKNPKWTFLSNLIFYSGNPVTVPKLAHFNIRHYPALDYIYSDRNNARMPYYQRIDLGANKTFRSKKGHQKEWNFSIYNAFLSKNAFAVEYTANYDYIKTNYPLGPSFLNEKKIRSFLLFIPGISLGYSW